MRMVDLTYRVIWATRFATRNGRALQSLEARAARRLLDELRSRRVSTTPVPRVRIEELSTRELGALVRADDPVVIEGLMKASRALEWTLGSLKAECGNSRTEGVVQVGTEAVRAPKLADVIAGIEMDLEASMSGATTVFDQYPALLRQLDVAQFERTFQRSIVMAQLFVNSRKSLAFFHSEFISSLSVQIRGQKKWTFVAPDRFTQMYPDVGYRGRREMFYYLAARPYTASDGTLERALVDAPLVERADKQVAVLDPGDVLYVPMWWWHQVSNLTPAIGVGLRLSPTAADLARRPLRATLGLSSTEIQRMIRTVAADKLRRRQRRLLNFAPNGMDYFGDRKDEIVASPAPLPI